METWGICSFQASKMWVLFSVTDARVRLTRPRSDLVAYLACWPVRSLVGKPFCTWHRHLSVHLEVVSMNSYTCHVGWHRAVFRTADDSFREPTTVLLAGECICICIHHIPFQTPAVQTRKWTPTRKYHTVTDLCPDGQDRIATRLRRHSMRNLKTGSKVRWIATLHKTLIKQHPDKFLVVHTQELPRLQLF